MDDRMTFCLNRSDETSEESIELTFDHSDMDIHDVLKKFAQFLISASYAPEAVQLGVDYFDIEQV